MEVIIPKRTIIMDPSQYPSEFLDSCCLRLPLWGHQHRMVGSKFADYSPYGNHGTPFGGYWDRQGQTRVRGNDGVDDGIRITDSPSLHGFTQFTLTAWVKLNTLGVNQRVIGKDYVGSAYPDYVLMVTDTNKLRVGVNNGTGPVTGANYVTADSASTLTSAIWYKVEGIYDGSQLLQTFINAIADGTPVATSGPVYSNGYDVAIGYAQPSNAYLAGFIAEFQIYNRAKSPEEIRAQYLYDIQHLPFLVGATYLRKYA